MNEYMDKWKWIVCSILGLELLVAFGSWFWWIRKTSLIHNLYLRAQKTWQKQNSLIEKIDQMLLYSGLYQKCSFLTTERFLLFQLLGISGITLVILLFGFALWKGLMILAAFFVVQYILISTLMAGNYKKVDEELLKFLDFMGNYSITSGEISSILFQISAYLDEPLRSVLKECYYEAQTFGDTSAALISMSKKLQHPKFAEVIRNVEVTMRYSADFTILVSQSRKSVREHMRLRQERKALAKEAGANMLILGGMTVLIFLCVEKLAGVSIEEVLFKTWIGRGCLAGIGGILFLFYQQVRKIDK